MIKPAEIAFTIPGPPVPWKRKADAYDEKRGRQIRVTDTRTRDYQRTVLQLATLATSQAGARFTGRPVIVHVNAVKARPKRRPDKVPPDLWFSSRVPCPVTPDTDNIAKNIMDGLNPKRGKRGRLVRRGLWEDDGLSAGLVVFEWYAADGEEPKVEVNVREWPIGSRDGW